MSKPVTATPNENEDDTHTEMTHDRARSIAEWTTLTISTLILLGIVGAILWLSLTGADHPPRIVVDWNPDKVRHEESGYYVEVVVRNEGNQTVENATIEGRLAIPGEDQESAELTIPFLAGGDKAQCTLVFRGDPASGELTTGVTSYKKP